MQGLFLTKQGDRVRRKEGQYFSRNTYPRHTVTRISREIWAAKGIKLFSSTKTRPALGVPRNSREISAANPKILYFVPLMYYNLCRIYVYMIITGKLLD